MGGLLEAVVGDATLGSAGGTGALFSTSADMVRSEPQLNGQGKGGRGVKQTAAPCSGVSEVNRTDDS